MWKKTKRNGIRIWIIFVRLLSITNYTLIFTTENVMTRFDVRLDTTRQWRPVAAGVGISMRVANPSK